MEHAATSAAAPSGAVPSQRPRALVALSARGCTTLRKPWAVTPRSGTSASARRSASSPPPAASSSLSQPVSTARFGVPLSSKDVPLSDRAIEECKRSCALFPECHHFVANTGAATTPCYLRQSVTLPNCDQDSHFTTFTLQGAPQFTWVPRPDINCFSGKGGVPISPDDQPLTGASILECESACASTLGCAAFVTDYLPEATSDVPLSCWLRRSVSFPNCAKIGGYATFTPPTELPGGGTSTAP